MALLSGRCSLCRCRQLQVAAQCSAVQAGFAGGSALECSAVQVLQAGASSPLPCDSLPPATHYNHFGGWLTCKGHGSTGFPRRAIEVDTLSEWVCRWTALAPQHEHAWLLGRRAGGQHLSFSMGAWVVFVFGRRAGGRHLSLSMHGCLGGACFWEARRWAALVAQHACMLGRCLFFYRDTTHAKVQRS